MGLLSGLFGGGGSSSSTATTTDQSTTVTTETVTNITGSNFGFTGRDAVELAAIIEAGATERSAFNTRALNNVIQASGQGFNRLVGVAGTLVNTGFASVEASRDAEQRGRGERIDVFKFAPLAIAAIAAVFAIRAIT